MARPFAIVTGAAQGIGRATALQLARDGYDVGIVDLRGEGAESTLSEVRTTGADGAALAVDVTDSAAVNDAVDELIRRFGRVDALVNNAGTHVTAKVVDLSDDAFDRTVNTILKGTFYFTRAVLPTMIDRRAGAIVNVSSVLAWHCTPAAAPYCAAKAAVTAFTKSVSFEVGEYGIRVNAVAPGLVDTELYRATVAEDERAALLEQCPLGRECTPEEVAAPIAFLLSDAASWVNGDTVTVSGGLFLR